MKFIVVRIIAERRSITRLKSDRLVLLRIAFDSAQTSLLFYFWCALLEGAKLMAPVEF